MASELSPIDISELDTLKNLSKVVDEVGRTRKARVIRRANKDVAVLSPVVPATKKRQPRGRVLTEDDVLFHLVGLGHSGGPGDVSANKHRYLSKAYAAKTHRDPAV